MQNRPSLLVAGSVLGLLAVGAAVLVASTLRRPEVPTYEPTPVRPEEVGARLVGPVTYTVDATDETRWRFFDFSSGSVVERPGPLEWDLAVQRFNVIVNGGAGFEGRGGALDLGNVAFDAVMHLPSEGYETTVVRRDSTHGTFRGWYDYGFTTHLLTPKPRVYAVRTADGRYAKVQILSYYCSGARPGCFTFRYVYQGEGGIDLGADPGSGDGAEDGAPAARGVEERRER